MELFLNYIFRLLFILIGGLMIRHAIVAYNNKMYFRCGFCIMFAVYEGVYLIKTIFEI